MPEAVAKTTPQATKPQADAKTPAKPAPAAAKPEALAKTTPQATKRGADARTPAKTAQRATARGLGPRLPGGPRARGLGPRLPGGPRARALRPRPLGGPRRRPPRGPLGRSASRSRSRA